MTVLISGMMALFALEEGDPIPNSMCQKLGITSDKIYVIDFFASWCHSCEKELPQLSKITKVIDTNHVVVLGVDVDENLDKGKKFQEALRRNSDLTFDVVNDPQNTIIKAFEPIGMPAIYILKDQKVFRVLFGAMDHVDSVVLEILKGIQ
jgi:cytochrome c biogenesis protein CcmG, thiol:disulfide interchange protein DsbE